MQRTVTQQFRLANRRDAIATTIGNSIVSFRLFTYSLTVSPIGETHAAAIHSQRDEIAIEYTWNFFLLFFWTFRRSKMTITLASRFEIQLANVGDRRRGQRAGKGTPGLPLFLFFFFLFFFKLPAPSGQWTSNWQPPGPETRRLSWLIDTAIRLVYLCSLSRLLSRAPSIYASGFTSSGPRWPIKICWQLHVV